MKGGGGWGQKKSNNFLKTLWIQFSNSTFKMTPKIPKLIWGFIHLLPLVSNFIVLIKRILPAGSEDVFFNSDLSSSDKQMKFIFEDDEFNVWIDGLVTWEIPLSSPLVQLNVIGLYGKHTLMVSTGSSNIVDGVVVDSCQTLDPRHSHRS